MTPEPTIHLMCGLVAASKTTLARKLAEELPAVRLSRDEWMIRLHGLPHEDPECAILGLKVDVARYAG